MTQRCQLLFASSLTWTQVPRSVLLVWLKIINYRLELLEEEGNRRRHKRFNEKRARDLEAMRQKRLAKQTTSDDQQQIQGKRLAVNVSHMFDNTSYH